MKAILIFLFSISTVVNLYSQIDTPTQGGTIDNNSPFSVSPTNLDTFNTDTNTEGLVKPESNFSFGEEEKFADNGTRFNKTLKTNNTGDKKMLAKFKSDQYLGDFRSNSGFVKVICRDYEYPDGDRIQVYVNDVMIKSDILLEYDYKGFNIELTSGFNKIDFKALNQGTSGPNTAEFKIFDDQGKLVSENQWNLATGVKATVIIVKE